MNILIYCTVLYDIIVYHALLTLPYIHPAPCHWNFQKNGCSAIGVTGSDEHYSYDEFCYCSQYCHLYWEWIPDEQQYVERGDCCRDALLFDNCIGNAILAFHHNI